MNKLKQAIKSILNESAKINFAGHTFVLKIDTNDMTSMTQMSGRNQERENKTK